MSILIYNISKLHFNPKLSVSKAVYKTTNYTFLKYIKHEYVQV